MTTFGFQTPPAPTGTAEKRPEDRRTEFVAVEGAEGQTTSAAGLVVAAYLVMWVLLVGFIWLSWRRSQQMERRVATLERALTQRDGEKS